MHDLVAGGHRRAPEDRVGALISFMIINISIITTTIIIAVNITTTTTTTTTTSCRVPRPPR